MQKHYLTKAIFATACLLTFTGMASSEDLVVSQPDPELLDVVPVWPKRVVVNVPVTDILMLDPTEGKASSSHQKRMTQALFSERLEASEESQGWYHVTTFEQSQTNGNKMTIPIEGWVLADNTLEVPHFDEASITVISPKAKLFSAASSGGGMTPLSMGTQMPADNFKWGWWTVHQPDGSSAFTNESDVSALSERRAIRGSDLRKEVVHTGMLLIGTPYLEGGRSYPCMSSILQEFGVDEGGMIELIFRTFGMHVPRTSQGLYDLSVKLRQEPCAGDLLFLADVVTGEIRHVMLIVHDDLLLEASEEVKAVHTRSASEMLGKPIHRFKSGDGVPNIPKYVIYFGTYIS